MADLAETARQNGIVTIAEGIETADHFHLVAGCGIRIMQGYWLAGPRSKILNHNELRHIVQRMRAARESDPSAWSLRPLRPAV